MSDRASQGVYSDRSGPKIVELLETHFENKRDHLDISTRLIPDEPDQLEREFEQAAEETVDLVITTGGTGIGPRDCAPDVTASFCEKLIPGIMENIRIKYGSKKPGALLTRGVVGVKKTTTLINFPGSVRACTEYFSEFITVWDHLRRMIHSIDNH